MKLALLLMSFYTMASCNNIGTICNAKYNSTYDGDTFYVDIPKFPELLRTRMGIRIKGINTPEIRGGSAYEKSQAKKAKAFTEAIVSKAKKITLTSCEKGKYFRLVCDVSTEEVTSVADDLIINNLAVKVEY